MSARLSSREKLLRGVSEADWQRQVIEVATLYGWRYYHAPENRPVVGRNGKRYVQNIRAGWPDLTLAKDRLIFAELKTQTGAVTAEQWDWLDALAAVPGVETYVWRPGDMDEVREVLSA